MRRSAPRWLSHRAISALTSGATRNPSMVGVLAAVIAARGTLLSSPFLKAAESARPEPMTTRVVDILVPVALDQTYSYRVPAGLDLAPGNLVSVSLGARECMGVVWAENPAPNPRLHNRLKDVDEKLDVPPLKPELRQFVDWVSNYTLASRGMVLRMALRMGEHLGPGRERIGVRLGGPAPERMTAARARVLHLLANGLTLLKSEAAHEASVSVGVIDGLID